MRTMWGKFVVAGGTFLLFGALSVGLSSCAGPDTPGAGSAPSASSTPGATAPAVTSTPSAKPSATPNADVARVVISADAIDVTSGDTNVTLSYFDQTESAIDALSAVFGAGPTVGVWEGGIESSPGATYTWPGLVIIDAGEPTLAPTSPEYRVSVTAAEHNGVSLETVDGVQVGDSASDLESAYPDTATRISVGGAAERLDVLLGAIVLPHSDDYPEMDGQLTFSVRVAADDPSGLVDVIAAPSPNFGT